MSKRPPFPFQRRPITPAVDSSLTITLQFDSLTKAATLTSSRTLSHEAIIAILTNFCSQLATKLDASNKMLVGQNGVPITNLTKHQYVSNEHKITTACAVCGNDADHELHKLTQEPPPHVD